MGLFDGRAKAWADFLPLLQSETQKLAESDSRNQRLTKALLDQSARRETAEKEAAELRSQVPGLERQTGHLLEALDRERTLLQRAMERNETLVDKIVEMKREGFVPAPFANAGNLEKLTIDLDDQVIDAIGQRSMGDQALERQLIKWAMAAMREKNASPEDVAQRILRGGSSEEDDDE